jgi:hypothetical protein
VEFWREWFARNPDAHFDAEEIIVTGGRAVVAGYTARLETVNPGIFAVWTSSRCAMEK